VDTERFGFRSAEYSSWHRTASLRRYLGEDLASTLSTVDLDNAIWIEHSDGAKEPLLLIETALDVEQEWKATSVIRQLARRANLPAYVVLYKPARHPNSGDARFNDIERFRVKRVWPDPDGDWITLSPQQWAERLLVIRARGAARLDNEARQSQPGNQLELVGRAGRYSPGTQ